MNKRRLRLLVALGGAVVLGMFILHCFGFDWKLYGWLRGEQFCDGFPASYYAARIRAAWVIRADLGGSVRPRQRSVVEKWLWRYHAGAVADAMSPDYIHSNDSPAPFRRETSDATKLPVLLVLLNDSDMRVRWWASQKLAQVHGEDAFTAAVALERLLRDEDPSNRFIGVLALKLLGPPARSALPTLFALRGDTTQVKWMRNRFDSLVDQAIRSIDSEGLP